MVDNTSVATNSALVRPALERAFTVVLVGPGPVLGWVRVRAGCSEVVLEQFGLTGQKLKFILSLFQDVRRCCSVNGVDLSRFVSFIEDVFKD